MKRKEIKGLKLWFDRLLSKSLLRQLAILAAGLILAFVVSYLLLLLSGTEWQRFCDQKKMSRWMLPLYLLIDSNALNNLYIGGGAHGWMLFASSVTFLVGAFVFNGAIIGIITNSIEQRVMSHRGGHIHYLKSGHYIIMGYDDMVPSIISHIIEKDREAYILILSAAEAPYIREKLKRDLGEKPQDHIIVNYGHRMSTEYYSDIHLEASKEIFIVGKRSLPAHDAINVECVDSICRYLENITTSRKPSLITCVFDDLDTYSAFKTSEIFGHVKKLGIEFMPYNFYTGWAKQVFVDGYHRDMDHPGETIPYPSVFAGGISPDDKRHVHLLFVGTTNFAVAFAIEAAHVLHFPNFATNAARTLITFIDINADKEKDEFITRYRHFFEIQPYYYCDLSQNGKYRKQSRDEYVCFSKSNGYTEHDSGFLDVEFEFIKGDIFSQQVQNAISLWASDKENQYLSIFLALSNQRQNFAFGMNMPDEVYDNQIPIFIRQDKSDNFVSNLRRTDQAVLLNPNRNTYYKVVDNTLTKTPRTGRYANIYPFGMNDTAYSGNDETLKWAKLINYLYCTMPSGNKFQSVEKLDALSPAELRTDAEKYWNTVALKWSNLYNAYTIRIKLASLRAMRGLAPDDYSEDTSPLSDDEVAMLARVEHNRWNVEKLLLGYRKPHSDEDKYQNPTFADELKKNKGLFIHHDIRPYQQLAGIAKLDEEFSRYIPWLLTTGHRLDYEK